MPVLVWDPIEMMRLLGIPSVEEDGIWHHFCIEQHSLRLQVTIWTYDSDIELLLWSMPLPDPVLRYTLLGSPGLRIISDKRGEFIEFAAANTFTGRYDGVSVIPYGLRLWVEPQIRIEPFSYPV